MLSGLTSPGAPRPSLRIIGLGLALALALVPAGCAVTPRGKVSSTGTDYNLVVEKTQNEMLLLNIVRASKRRPMYFTGFNLLRGNMSYNVTTGSISIPFGTIGTGFNGAYSINPALSYSTNPSFDVGVLDTKEFTLGIMTPLSMETLDYYFQQGWPRELLLHLFISRIETLNNGRVAQLFDNYPEKESFEKFRNEVRNVFLKCNLEVTETLDPVGPRIKSTDTNIAQLIEVQKAGMVLAPVGEKEGEAGWYQLRAKKARYQVRCEGEAPLLVEPGTGGAYQLISNGTPVARIYFRSAEAVLYYLGEILRAERDTGFTPLISACVNMPPVPLFLARVATGADSSPIVSVDYEGTRFVIPRDPRGETDDGCRSDRSMHVLSLLSLLMAQQRSGQYVPVTGVVNVIGR